MVAIVVIVRHTGDPERLMAAGRELAGLHPDGVLAQAIAPTEDGMILVRIWESQLARAAWSENPEHHAALKASGIFDASENRTSRAYETDLFSVVGAGPPVPGGRADTR
jgi:heme-degrading monooxygenase HmoA